MNHTSTNLPPSASPRKIEITISTKGLFKILAVGLLVFVVVKLHTILILLFLGLLLAVSLQPVVHKLHRNLKVPHGVAVALVALGIVTLIGAVTFFLIPSVSGQVNLLFKE